ncbi:terminase large subunit domain-containing protein [Nocardioides antri]|uniref:Uncharacterized protein n=1 Tax=Nocardioides antri TaxID=2607659 RepID=A0A5B1LZX7_9ACTN|nr:terminase family protein [Nocardioides antri]KAA1426465.1 hypothetical protein F0U47_13770 [Nocardioides antri]
MGDRGIEALDRARRDAGVFAELLLGAALWPHQLEVVASPARYRVICAGRQVGKSRLLAILALHRAFAQAGAVVLLVSAGDTAAKRLLEDVATLALGSPMLAGSVIDESSKAVTLSNGSVIRAVPASAAQIRGWAVDLLIVDEAAFIDQEIWRAAEPAIIARPGSRVVLSSSPWGSPDHFFRALWTRGTAEPTVHLAAWHWPSITSPLVDEALLEEIRAREAPAYFEREFEAKWTDSAGAYFTTAELEAATARDGEHELVDLDAAAGCGQVVGGVDWGMQRDAHALVVVAAIAGEEGLDERGRQRYWVPFVEERFATDYDTWIDRLVKCAGAFVFGALVAETNGVGQMPTQQLARRLWEASGRDLVVPVATTARLKEDLFGFMRLLVQQKRLVLPREPSLLRQLGALEFVQGDGGVMRIAVPERSGHDDVAMAFAFALQPLMGGEMVPVLEGVVEDYDLDEELADYRIAPYDEGWW